MERKQVTEEIDEIVVNYKEIHQIVNAVLREHEGEAEVGYTVFDEAPLF
jgi:hypothetical protein